VYKVACILALWFCMTPSEAQVAVDNMPLERLQRVAEFRSTAKSADAKLTAANAAYVVDTHRWKPGGTVNVAFLGGNVSLHKAIERVANEWTQYANIRFDFGYDPTKNAYRQWSRGDKTYAARIRISFDQPGHYSAVGTESVNPDPKLFPPNRESMNFSAFDVQYPNAMPDAWEAIVRHEFGHALGLWHEHQKPICTREIRWTDDGVHKTAYAYYSEILNWPPGYTDSNLRPPSSVDDVLGDGDKVNLDSILIYLLPPEILVNGEKSPCFTKKLPVVFSELDKQAVRRAYPSDPNEVLAEARAAKVPAMLASVARSDILSVPERITLSARIESRTIADRPNVYVQIPSEAVEATANELRQSLKVAGFIAPELETVGTQRSPRRLEVRYFASSSKDSADAIAAMLVRTSPGSGTPSVKQVRGYEGKVKRTMIEVWYPTNDAKRAKP